MLSVDALVTAGADVTVQLGLESVTFLAVAEQLGVSSRALYHHVPGVRELRWLVVDHVLMLMPSLDPAGDARTQLDGFARAARAVFHRYPGVADQLLQFGPMSEQVYRIVDGCVATYASAGMSVDDAGRCAAMFLSWLLSFVARERTFNLAPVAAPEGLDHVPFDGLAYSELFEFELGRMLVATVELAPSASTY
jgi:AcrR family transcriptional regulator